MNKKTIALIDSPYNEKYQKIIKNQGHNSILFDAYNEDNWIANMKKMEKKADVYYWQSGDRGHYYREWILDKVYFIEKYSAKKIFPDYNQYFTFNDKTKQHYLFQKYDIPTPKTFYTKDKSKALDFIKKTSYPFVLKDPHSASGYGVYLLKNKKEAAEMIEKIFSPEGFNSLYSQFYAQKFIPDLEKSLRVITIGNKVYCAYYRINPDDWKINLGPKTSISDKNIPKQALKLAESISKKLNYHWMAYDILEYKKKYYVIEYSCNFGVTGAEALGYDPLGELIKYTLKKI